MVFNYSNITSAAALLTAPNTASHGMFWFVILVVTMVIILMATIYTGWEIAMLLSSFICTVAGIFLVYGGLMGWSYEMMFVSILLLMILYVYWSSTRDDY
jgi:hypothetical protein